MADRRPPRKGGGSHSRPGGGGGPGGGRPRRPGGPGQGGSRRPGGQGQGQGPGRRPGGYGQGGGQGGGPGRGPAQGRRPGGPGGGSGRPPERRGEGGPGRGRPPGGPRERDERRPTQPPVGEERIQKLLAHSGIASRRACEDLILQGRVTVDGKVVRELGTKVDPTKHVVAVDGQRIHEERHVYFAVYKPKGYVSTNNDPSGRPRVLDLLPEIPQRVYTIGRLDEASTGLLLLTNDGELANKLAHPKFGVEKIYRVVVAGSPAPEVLNQLTEGIWLAEGKVKAKRVRVIGKRGESTILEMVLAEGKNREVRRMLAKLGHKVMSLTRVSVGPISVKGLKSGEVRPLTGREIELLRRAAAGEFTSSEARSKPKRERPRPVEAEGGEGPAPRRPAPDRAPRRLAPSGGPGRPGGGPPQARGPRPAGGPPASRGPRPAGGPPPRVGRPPIKPQMPEGDVEVSPVDESVAPPSRPRRVIGLDLPKPAGPRKKPPMLRRPKPGGLGRGPGGGLGPRLKRRPPKPDEE